MQTTMLTQAFRARDLSRRVYPLLADVAVVLGTLALLYGIARVGAGALVSFRPPANQPSISLEPANLPYYAARSTLRMFLALVWSIVFTLAYGYVAAHSRRAERVLVPLLDILQSVPVLGFLSITVTAFIALFPGSLLGLELASVFAIFTSQAWNMAFSFYQSLKMLPRELDEAVTLYRLPRWQRFSHLEVPAAMIGLIWNAMLSFGGGWFFLAASEAISVLNQQYTLPGIGSYVASAVGARDLRALAFALLTMAVLILLIDQLFWRPLVAWADKFKMEKRASAEPPRSWLYDLLRTSRVPGVVGTWLTPLGESLESMLSRLLPVAAGRPSDSAESDSRWGDWILNGVLVAVVVALFAGALNFILGEVGLGEVVSAVLMGLATFVRVVVLLIFSTLIWTPVGVTIGFNPRLARLAQPLVQFLASFPANFLFPFATILFIAAGVSLNAGGILLMALGAQWYILFNVIAGAISIPTDMREMANNMGLRGWRLWRAVIIPGIFSAWVTGAITAAGGAWNASIVSEIVTWGSTTLVAYGLGSYIAQATAVGDWPRIVLGVGTMSLFVVGLNRIFWQRLYRLGEQKYHLG